MYHTRELENRLEVEPNWNVALRCTFIPLCQGGVGRCGSACLNHRCDSRSPWNAVGTQRRTREAGSTADIYIHQKRSFSLKSRCGKSFLGVLSFLGISRLKLYIKLLFGNLGSYVHIHMISDRNKGRTIYSFFGHDYPCVQVRQRLMIG